MAASVTIVGAGEMARGIATRLLSGGVPVALSARNADAAAALADELRARAGEAGPVEVLPYGEVAPGSVVILAVPFGAVEEVVEAYRARLAGAVVVDISNPLDWATMDSLVTAPGTSAAEEVERLAGGGARVLKAFNTTFAVPLVAGHVAGRRLDVLIAGDDEDAKAALGRLVEAGGLNAVDVGPLRRARELEAFQLLHIAAQERLGSDFASAVSLTLPGLDGGSGAE